MGIPNLTRKLTLLKVKGKARVYSRYLDNVCISLTTRSVLINIPTGTGKAIPRTTYSHDSDKVKDENVLVCDMVFYGHVSLDSTSCQNVSSRHLCYVVSNLLAFINYMQLNLLYPGFNISNVSSHII